MKKTTLMIVAFILIASFVHAQGIGIGPILGIHKAADADDSQLMGGAALRLKLSSSLGFEGSIQYRQEKYADDAVTVRSWPVMASVLIYPLPILYGVVGAGWYNTTFDYDIPGLTLDNETSQEFGFHFGGGLELDLGSATLIGDVRYVFLNYEFDSFPNSEDLSSDFFLITVGILFGL